MIDGVIFLPNGPTPFEPDGQAVPPPPPPPLPWTLTQSHPRPLQPFQTRLTWTFKVELKHNKLQHLGPGLFCDGVSRTHCLSHLLGQVDTLTVLFSTLMQFPFFPKFVLIRLVLVQAAQQSIHFLLKISYAAPLQGAFLRILCWEDRKRRNCRPELFKPMNSQ